MVLNIMKLKTYVSGAYGSMIFDDDVTEEEIKEAVNLLATTEPGNGSGRIFYRRNGSYGEEKNTKKRP